MVRTLVLACTTVMALLLAGCNDAGDSPATAEPPATEGTNGGEESTPTEPTPAEEASAVLMEFLEFRDEAYRTGEIDPDELDRLTTGDAHLRIRTQVFNMHHSENPVTIEGEYGHTLSEPAQQDSTTYLIRDCEDHSNLDSRLRESGIETTTFDPEGNPLPDKFPVDYEVIDTEDGWRVSDSNLVWREQC
jgi:hypothetical protein